MEVGRALDSSSATPAKSTNPSSISKVRVIARVRPFLPQEIPTGNRDPTPCASVIEQESESATEEVVVHLKDKVTSRNECYRLDSFFAQEDNNVGRIFSREVCPLIPGLFLGCNATVFAYGATGSGKTYTIQGTDEMPGLMELSMSKILSMCQSTGSSVELSYYEVYMDRCYDLLEIKAKEITVLDDKDGQVHLKGLSRFPVKSMFEFYEAFSCGIQRRKTAHTGLNDVSSRSHGVLVIAVSTPLDDGSGDAVTGKLNLIDLAGNEDNRRTCNEGTRLQESAKINQSLFALSNVIYALNNNLSRVPYRESKLTRILQDSLGGMSQALMITCLNPGEYQESVHTVSLAARSRHITNFVPSAHKQETPKVKVDMEAKLCTWLESRGKTRSARRIEAFNSPLLGKTPSSSIANVKKPNINLSSMKSKVNTNRSACSVKERTIKRPIRNIFDNESLVDSNLESLQFAAKDNKQVGKAGAGGSIFESNTSLPGEPSNQEENSANDSSTISGKKNTPQSSLRKALSPVNTNINQNPLSEPMFTNGDCTLLFDPKTPKTPSLATCPKNMFQRTGTPLDKFTACGSNLKKFLLQDYIDFLNTANREELLELKGIGVKMAEYILELRETSPLKSLNDLEKIGLSTKQIVNLFNKAAIGVLDKEIKAVPSCSDISQVKQV
ncbi:kinesin-like protein KIN-10B isoform X1 [Pyrus x bretschneideri]|uniref:kinesin-like protein KIN-10B isoform X1 n=1 Tax=Pyrus x bretschneideri TaxID=225117 RepID=UPI0020303D54|nr:kinesin-like protein KIN-10B isoform X1 [Pyrus x bretschneideri]